jgi:hypothetical protein
MVALLVPGATTVTPHSRYYALHALAAVEAQRRNRSLEPLHELVGAALFGLERTWREYQLHRQSGVSAQHESMTSHLACSQVPMPIGVQSA